MPPTLRCAHLKLVYQTYGLLNAEKSNCILHPTSYDATHPELEYNVGPGKLLDAWQAGSLPDRKKDGSLLARKTC